MQYITRSDNDLVIKAFGAEDAVAVSNDFSTTAAIAITSLPLR